LKIFSKNAKFALSFFGVLLKLQLYMLFLQVFATAKLALGKNKIIQNSKSGVGVPPYLNTKPTILRNCGRSFYP